MPNACVLSLPRSGTTSLATVLRSFNAYNEFEEELSIRLYLEFDPLVTNKNKFASRLQNRFSRMGVSSIDCASYNWLIAEEIIGLYPNIRYICLRRDIPSWLNSFVKMLHYYHDLFSRQGRSMPDWMTDYGLRFAQSFNWKTISSLALGNAGEKEAKLITELCLSWKSFDRLLFNYADKPNFLIVDTNQISFSLNTIQDFLGITLDSRDKTVSHVNKAKLPGWVLSPELANLYSPYATYTDS